MILRFLYFPDSFRISHSLSFPFHFFFFVQVGNWKGLEDWDIVLIYSITDIYSVQKENLCVSFKGVKQFCNKLTNILPSLKRGQNVHQPPSRLASMLLRSGVAGYLNTACEPGGRGCWVDQAPTLRQAVRIALGIPESMSELWWRPWPLQVETRKHPLPTL